MRGKSAEEKAKIIERQTSALRLRRAGWSYRKIGAQLKVDHTTAFDDVQKALAALTKERDKEAEFARELELQRLDMLLEGLEGMAAIGQPGAVLSFLKVCESRRKLLGIDAPAKTYNFNVEIVAKAWEAIEAAGVNPIEAFERIIAKAHADAHSG